MIPPRFIIDVSIEPDSKQAQADAPCQWLTDEQERLSALRNYALLDIADDLEFDRLTLLSSQFCGMPIAAISLVDCERQWFFSRTGLTVTEIDREVSFCSHTIRLRDVLVVPDATVDVRFRDNPLVTGEPNIRFYAAAPLITPEGYAIGTLCVIDKQPRTFSSVKRKLLSHLASMVMAQLETRRAAYEALPQGQRELRNFWRIGQSEFARSRRFRRPISLLWLEIYSPEGLEVGTDVLTVDLQSRVHLRLAQELRTLDRIALPMAGAVAVLLIEVDSQLVQATAERLRQLAEQTLSDQGSALAICGGVASLAMVDQNFEDLLQRAQVLSRRARHLSTPGSLCFIDEIDLASEQSPGPAWLLDGRAELLLDRSHVADGSTSDVEPLQALPRQAFFSCAQREWERARRFGRPLSMLLLNLDNLGQLNACWGRSSRDAVLLAVRGIIQRDLRDQDQLGLLGEDRFGVLMPETTGSAALVIAERIRRLVASHRFQVSHGQLHFVTISAGISCNQQDDVRFGSLFDRTEEALLTAKESGGNRVCSNI